MCVFKHGSLSLQMIVLLAAEYLLLGCCAEYIGCFKIRNVNDTSNSDPSNRWYDPHHLIFVGDDSRYAEGPFYALSAHVISGIIRSGLTPRLGGPEGEASAAKYPCDHFDRGL